MAHRARWRELGVGVGAAVAVAAAAVAVLVFARVGALRGDTFRLFARVGSARGLMKGSEVWVGGQRVGRVADIRFLPPAGREADALLIEMDVLERHQQAIRRDSRAEIRAGARLIAAPVVAISAGTPGARMVREGDTIRAQGQADVEGLLSRFGDIAREFPPVIADVKRVNEQLRSSRGTIGAFGSEGGAVELAAVRARGGRLASRFSQGGGTLGRLFSDRGALVARAQAALARADSVQQLLGSDAAAVGRFRRDSTLRAMVGDIQNELSIVRAMLDDARGTAGRLSRDRAIVDALMEAEREMGAIMADIRRRPFRYLSF
jgi:phospholipid/cholesterol/gamma-HCH transport system substrate-binding protein